MKITELIKELEKMYEEHGDLDVRYYDIETEYTEIDVIDKRFIIDEQGNDEDIIVLI